MRLLIALTTVLLISGCASGPVDPGPNPVITILPPASENPPRVAYCKRDGDNLNVQFKNIGGLATTGSVDVTVTFSTSPPTATTRTRGPLIVGEVATLPYPIPLGCFSPDCRFKIKWSNQPEVAGICIG